MLRQQPIFNSESLMDVNSKSGKQERETVKKSDGTLMWGRI